MSDAREDLVAEIEREFKRIVGPPDITLSVARGIDDHQHDNLAALAREQRHHKHWRHVSKEEIQKYHNTWNFMDCEAFRFYLPAFMADALEEVSDRSTGGQPAWMATGFFDPEPDRVQCFTSGQKRCVLQFLESVYSMSHPLDQDYFREKILDPWRRVLIESVPANGSELFRPNEI